MPSKRQQYDRANRRTKREAGWYPTIDPSTGKPCKLIQVAHVSFTPPTRAADVPTLLAEIEHEIGEHPRRNHLASYCTIIRHEIERIREHLAPGPLDHMKLAIALYRLGVYVERMRAEVPARERGKSKVKYGPEELPDIVAKVQEAIDSQIDRDPAQTLEEAFNAEKARNGWDFGFSTWKGWKRKLRQASC